MHTRVDSCLQNYVGQILLSLFDYITLHFTFAFNIFLHYVVDNPPDALSAPKGILGTKFGELFWKYSFLLVEE